MPTAHRGSIVAVVSLLALSLFCLAAGLAGVPRPRLWLIAGWAAGACAGAIASWRLVREARERALADREVVHREGRLRGILDSAMDAIITVDDGQRVVL